MERQLTAFVERPSRQTYLAVRDAVLRTAPLPLATTDLADLERLLDAGAAQQALDRLDALPSSKVLSPRVHLMAAEAAEAVGDLENGEVERFLFVLCLQGLLATGEGTPADPYLVCHATDEYDVLEALDLQPAGQSLVEHEGRLCDVLVCTNGREVWFDASPMVSRPTPRRKAAARRSRSRKRPLTAGKSRR
jgi:hypothetical protein